MKYKHFLLETCAILIVLFIINILFFQEDLGFLRASPHPYWIPIILMASLYGARAAFMTSLLCSVLYLGFHYYAYYQAIESFWNFKVLGQPAYFLIFGSLIGHITQATKDTLSEYKQKYFISCKDRDQLKTKVQALEKIKEELEKKIVTQLSTITNVYDFAKKLETLDSKYLYQETLKILVQHLNIKQASFYKSEGNLLLLEASEFRENFCEPPKEINKTTGIFNIAITNQKVISVRDLFNTLDYPTLKKSPLICAPLYRKSGVLIGVITVDQIHFEQFVPGSIKLFGLVTEWLSNAIDNVLSIDEIKMKNITDEILGLYNYSYFQKRIKEEFDRSKRYALPMCLVLFKIQKYSNIKKEKQLAIQKLLVTLLQNVIRDIDIFSLYKEEDTWSIIFPTYPRGAVEKIEQATLAKIRELAIQPYESKDILEVTIAISDFTP